MIRIAKISILFCLGLLSLVAAALDIQFSAEAVAVGEPVVISISDQHDQPKLARFPKLENGGWLQNQSRVSQQSINGQTTYTIQLLAVAARPGELVIPPLEVTVGKQKITTDAKTIKVVEQSAAAAAADPANGLSARMVLADPARKIYYLDEEIPFDIELLIAPNLEVRQISYPMLDIPKSVFADYTNVNPENNKFDRPRQTRIERDGKLFHAVKFPGKFRMLGIGKPTISGEITIGVTSPAARPANRPRGFDDDFFDGFFGNARSVTPYTVKIAVPEDLEVIAPPAAPADAYLLNLIGDWQLSGSFDSDTAKVGEPLTLELKLSGDGNTETLKLPKLNIPDFRVYPPELKNVSDHSWSVKIVLIPLKEGDIPFAAKFAVFDPIQQKYRVFEINQTLHIQKGTLPQASAGANFIPEQVAAVPDTDDAKPAASQDLHYLKAQPYGQMPLPLGIGKRFWLWLLLIAGPATGLAIHWLKKRLTKRRNNPALLRRRQAIAHKKALVHELQNAAETRQLLNGKLSDFLINYYNLAPGSTVHELTSHVKNDELKTILKSLEDAAYAPTAPVGEEVRQKLCAIIKKLSLFLVLALAFNSLPLNAAVTPAGFAEGNQHFAEGNFKGAIEAYSRLLDLDNPDPYLLYNLGCAKFQTGDLPGALRDFEEAHLLLPCDRQILDNLNISRTKALLPKLHEIKSPGDLFANFRDLLRPDQWLVLAALTWFAGWVVCFAVKKHRYWFAGLAALVIAVALANIWWQQNGAYNPARLIMVKAAELRSFPNASAKVELTLPAGTDARLLDRKDDYCFIDSGGKTGWIKAADARKYFNN